MACFPDNSVQLTVLPEHGSVLGSVGVEGPGPQGAEAAGQCCHRAGAFLPAQYLT